MYYEQLNINYPLTYIVDVYDNCDSALVRIKAWDFDKGTNDELIDLGEASDSYLVETYFYPDPETTSKSSFTSNGRLDKLNELDGYIKYDIEVVEV